VLVTAGVVARILPALALGRGWVRVAAGKTTATGSFSLPAGVSGTFQVNVGTERGNTVQVQ
jgi:hypothetical protein